MIIFNVLYTFGGMIEVGICPLPLLSVLSSDFSYQTISVH